MKGLAHFRHAKHSVLIFQIWDPDELDFPFKQWTHFDCLEDAQKHTVDPSHLRQAYLENLEKYRENFTKGCHRNRIDLVPMTTDQPYADALAYYLALRQTRQRPCSNEFPQLELGFGIHSGSDSFGHSHLQPQQVQGRQLGSHAFVGVRDSGEPQAVQLEQLILLLIRCHPHPLGPLPGSYGRNRLDPFSTVSFFR